MSEKAPARRRVSGMRMRGGTVFDLDCCAVQVTDPDDAARVIVVPLSAVRLIFSPDFRAAPAHGPEPARPRPPA